MTTRRLIGTVIPALLLAASAQVAGAQWAGSVNRQLEGFYAQHRLDGAGGGAVTVDGVGARLMWSPAPVAGVNDLASRSALGLFAAYTPEQDGLGFSTLHAGAAMDVRPLATPLFGRVDPILSLGAGAFRTSVDQPNASRFALADRTNTTFALSPGIGARLGLWQGVGLRADVRDLMTFRGETRHNVSFGAGLSLTF